MPYNTIALRRIRGADHAGAIPKAAGSKTTCNKTAHNMTADDVPAASLRQHRPFALYWIARVSSTVALQMQAVAVSWQMYDLTRNPLDLGLVGLVQFLPAALLVLVAGHVADRYDRRMIVRTCNLICGLATATLAIGTAFGVMTRETLLAIVFVIGACRAFEQTTLTTLLPGIVSVALLPRATAAAASATQVAIIAGPAVGGLLYAVNPVLVYALCCTLYICAGLLIGMVTAVRTATSRAPVTIAVLFAGFSYIRRAPVILGAISLDLFAVLMGGVIALLPIYAEEILNLGPEGLGWLRAAPGIGAIAVAGILATFPIRDHAGHIMFACVALFGLFTVVFGLSTVAWLSILALILLGAADMVSVVVRETLLQLWTPDDVRGRVNAVNSVFVSASNELGEFRAGTMAHVIGAGAVGAVPAVVIGGAGAIVVAGTWAWMFPQLRKARRLDGSDVKHPN
jgi:MFS family permease